MYGHTRRIYIHGSGQPYAYLNDGRCYITASYLHCTPSSKLAFIWQRTLHLRQNELVKKGQGLMHVVELADSADG